MNCKNITAMFPLHISSICTFPVRGLFSAATDCSLLILRVAPQPSSCLPDPPPAAARSLAAPATRITTATATALAGGSCTLALMHRCHQGVAVRVHQARHAVGGRGGVASGLQEGLVALHHAQHAASSLRAQPAMHLPVRHPRNRRVAPRQVAVTVLLLLVCVPVIPPEAIVIGAASLHTSRCSQVQAASRVRGRGTPAADAESLFGALKKVIQHSASRHVPQVPPHLQHHHVVLTAHVVQHARVVQEQAVQVGVCGLQVQGRCAAQHQQQGVPRQLSGLGHDAREELLSPSRARAAVQQCTHVQQVRQAARGDGLEQRQGGLHQGLGHRLHGSSSQHGGRCSGSARHPLLLLASQGACHHHIVHEQRCAGTLLLLLLLLLVASSLSSSCFSLLRTSSALVCRGSIGLSAGWLATV
mmetsp:Transcript_19807/g.43073  ORF Transcript_19807/g.43073 Transcript_19807/m.43073 type:complete len:416 (-) Transcript_19807:583-1830(-)